jgi:macrolide-specific efflux system membrane fusion protein
MKKQSTVRSFSFASVISAIISGMKRIYQVFHGLSLVKKGAIIFIIAILAWFGVQTLNASKSETPTYQTATVEKGTLVAAVSVSGQVSGANSAEVTTQASGVVTAVYVKDGDTVKAGDVIAKLDLDLTGQQRSQQAYASYQSAQNNLETAKANLYTTQSTLLTEWESYMSKATNDTYENPDDSPNTANRQLTDFVITQNDWLASEAKYKIQEKAIIQAQTSLSSAWYAYQQSSASIVAPISGTVTGFSLQPGTVITAQTNSSGGSSSQRIASVKTNAAPTVSLNVTQIDAPKIKAGNKVTLTFDAFGEKTYTGEVVSVDTIGAESSGVTTYPAIVKLDAPLEGLLPNMSATASIIIATKDNVLLVPTTALTTTNGQTTVRVMKNKTVSQVTVETGLASDSQTEIISGLSEGDTIVTSVSTGSTKTTTGTTSVFSPFGRTSSGGNRQIQMIGR